MSSQQVAVVRPPRLSVPANLDEKYGIDPDSWEVLVNATFPQAKSAESVLMALAYCKQRGLDIFRKPIHLVPMETTIGGQKVTIDTVWPGIGETRITAHRQADFYGYDECEFGPLIEFSGEAKVQKWVGGQKSGWETIKWKGPVPEWARFTVYKMMHGQRIKLPGPKVYFLETYAPVGRYNPSPNERWTRAPRQMLEKCAEAAALRRAWPDVFGDEATYEEMEGRTLRGEAEETGPTPDKAAAGPRPTREDFKKNGAAAKDEIVEGEFSEVQDGGAADEKAAARAEQGQSAGKPAENPAAEVDEKSVAGDEQGQPDAAKETPAETLPSTRGQWEAWVDGFRDNLDARDTVEQVDRLVSANAHRLEAAPEDIQETLSKEVSAKRAQLSNGADSATGRAAGNNSQPEE